jgi:hypothetical protein
MLAADAVSQRRAVAIICLVALAPVARWRRTGWQPIGPASRHPLALAGAGLESVAPVVTGIPTTSIKDLIKEYPIARASKS